MQQGRSLQSLIDAIDNAKDKHLALWAKLKADPGNEQLASQLWEVLDDLGSVHRALYEATVHPDSR